MNIYIPLKVLFIVYTLALLGGAFGISYAAYEWQHDDAAERCEAALEAADYYKPQRAMSGISLNLVIGPTPPEIRSAIERYCE